MAFLGGGGVGVSIEQAMFFALGALVAGVAMLSFLPALWWRAERLSMRKLRMLAPLSREQALAERDLLRAEMMVRERRFEQQMEAVKASKAQDLIKIGRHAARIADLDAQLTKSQADGRELERRRCETDATLAERTQLLNSSEMALQELTDRTERLTAALRGLRSDHAELGRAKEKATTSVVAYAQTLGALHAQNTDLGREVAQLRGDLAKLKLAALRRAEIETELSRLTAEFGALSAAKRKTDEALEELRARALADSERRTNEISCLETALRLARAEAREQADRLEISRADNSMLQGAVNALRKDHARSRVLPGNGADFHDAHDGGEAAEPREEVVSLASRMVEAAPQRGQAPIKRAL